MCNLWFDFSEQLPYLKCPLHTVLKLTPVAYGKCSYVYLMYMSAYTVSVIRKGGEVFKTHFMLLINS